MAGLITQQAFMRAYTGLSRLPDRQMFYPWICAIASRIAVKCLKKTGESFPEADWKRIAEIGDDGMKKSMVKVTKEKIMEGLRTAIMRIKPEEREILVLRYYNGFSIKEIAGLFNLPVITLKMRLFSARKKLCRYLQ